MRGGARGRVDSVIASDSEAIQLIFTLTRHYVTPSPIIRERENFLTNLLTDLLPYLVT